MKAATLKNRGKNESSSSMPQQQTKTMRIMEKMHLVDKGAVPVNWKMISLSFLNLLGSGMCLSFIFPFLPEMVMSFGYSEEDKGYYAGIIASSLFAGRATGSYFWGWLADRKGRRPVMLITVLGNAVFSLLFGFSHNLMMAFIMRFLAGIVNGTVGCVKTVLYEVSDNTNQAFAMSILSVSWGAGFIIGPAMGGFLASPAKRYPHIFSEDGIFGQFPYLLPGIIVAVLCQIAVLLDFFILPETKIKILQVIEIGETVEEAVDTELGSKHSLMKSSEKLSSKITMSLEDLHVESEAAFYFAQLNSMKYADESDEEISFNHNHKPFHNHDNKSHQHGSKNYIDHDSENHHISHINQNRQRSKSRHNSCENDSFSEIKLTPSPLTSEKGQSTIAYHQESEENLKLLQKLGDDSSERETHELMLASSKILTSEEIDENSSWVCRKMKNTVLVKLLSQTGVRKSVFLYALFSFTSIGFDEIFTVWCSTTSGLGGLGFNPDKIGAVLGITAIPLLLIQFFLFPAMVRKLKIKTTFVLCTMIQMVLVSCTATLHLLVTEPKWLWTALLMVCIPLKLAASSCFSATSLFINNSVKPEQVGAVNGIGMTASAIARTLAPTVGGIMFAWTVGYASDKIGIPFDVSFVFFFFGIINFITAVLGYFLPEHLNKQKK